MIRIFRTIRQKLFHEGQMRKYSLYAIGEILLVVIGILVALQINNANEQRLQRQKEITHLENLKTDLAINVQQLDEFIAARSSRIESARKMIGYFDGAPIESLEEFSYHNVHVQLWKKFYQNNNTFQELVNSGSLGIISDDAIKNTLMDLELLYKKMKSDEDHMRFDFEEYVFKPFFDTVDIDPFTRNYVYTFTGGQAGDRVTLSQDAIELLLQDVRYKNGFTLAIYMSNEINAQFEVIKSRTLELIELINQDLQR
jgi:hypothetical protein